MNTTSRKITHLTFPDPQEKLVMTGERYVSGFAGTIQHEHFHRYLFAAEFCREKRVLDVACGEGYGCHLLSQVAAQVVGVDIDQPLSPSSAYMGRRLWFYGE